MGQDLLTKTCNRLPLYTNISKETSFYRILWTIKKKRKHVHPKVKRMMTMLYLFLKGVFERNKRNAFEKLKIGGKSKKVKFAEQIIKCSRDRKSEAIRLWLKEAKIRRDLENRKKGFYLECAKKLFEATIDRRRSAIQRWRDQNRRSNELNEIQMRFLNRCLMTKAGRVADAIRIWKRIPSRMDDYSKRKGVQFEKGLHRFANKTLKTSFDVFKNDYEKG